jgi:transposase
VEGLPAGVRSVHDDLQSLRAVGPTGRLGEAFPGACRSRSIEPNANDRFDAHQGASLSFGRKRGEQKQAIGRSRGGRNTKIHALADAKGRLLSLLLTGGQAHDCPPAQRLIRRVKAAAKLLGDKAYDSAPLRQWLKDRGTKAVVSQQVQPQATFQLRQEILQTTAPHRECLQSAQRLPTNRHALRQVGAKLPRLRLSRGCYRMVDLMSLDPSHLELKFSSL